MGSSFGVEGLGEPVVSMVAKRSEIKGYSTD